MRYLLSLLFFLALSCASVTLPDGSKLEAKGKAEAAIMTPRDTWSLVSIPFRGRVESEIQGEMSPGCPFLHRTYFDDNNKIVNEEYIAACEKVIYVKSDITIWNFLEFLVGAWAMMGFP